MPLKLDAYPTWICRRCGMKHGRRAPGLATYHEGQCDICKAQTCVTEPRDFGHLKIVVEEPIDIRICRACDKKEGSRVPDLAMWEQGTCDTCGAETFVTVPRILS